MHESIPHWDARFELGREDGDLQHRYFLNLVNRLAGALSDALAQLQASLQVTRCAPPR